MREYLLTLEKINTPEMLLNGSLGKSTLKTVLVLAKSKKHAKKKISKQDQEEGYSIKYIQDFAELQQAHLNDTIKYIFAN